MRTLKAWRGVVMTAALLMGARLAAAEPPVTMDPALIGAWAADPVRLGTLGACELLCNPAESGRGIAPPISLVFSTNSVRHRFQKKPGWCVAGPKTTAVKDADGTEHLVLDYRYRINTNATPHEIDFQWQNREGKAESSQGIYKIEGGTLWLAIGIAVWGGDRRPSDFEVQAISKSVIKARKQNRDR